MKNKLLASIQGLAVLAATTLPSLAFARRRGDWGGALSAPEFDTAAAGTVALIVIGGAFLILRRRRNQS